MRHFHRVLLMTMLGMVPALTANAETIVVGRIGAGSTAHWPIYVGQEKGLFKARGIELD